MQLRLGHSVPILNLILFQKCLYIYIYIERIAWEVYINGKFRVLLEFSVHFTRKILRYDDTSLHYDNRIVHCDNRIVHCDNRILRCI